MKHLAWLNTGIFPATIMFSCGFKFDELITLLKRKKTDHWYKAIENDKKLIDKGSYFALHRIMDNLKTGESRNYFYIIITEEFKFTDFEMCKLAHECLHICQFMLKDFLDRDREFECEAYLHTHIMQQCLKTLRDKK